MNVPKPLLVHRRHDRQLRAVRVGAAAVEQEKSDSLDTVYQIGSLAGLTVGAYHGFLRNRGSVGWAIGWGLLGGLFWPFVIPIAFAQGIGKPAGSSR